jgi:hypothetical protein
VTITKEIANNEFDERYTVSADEGSVNRREQSRLKATADYLNGKLNDRDYLAAMGLSTGENSWLDHPTTTKEEIAKRAKKMSEPRKKYLKNKKNQNNVSEEGLKVPVITGNGGSINNSHAQQGTLFAGKTLDDLNAKNGGLEGLLAMNAKSPIIKGVPAKNGKPARIGIWEALQAAESVGKPIDQDYVARGIQAIMDADKSEKSSMLNDLVHQIMCG